MTSADLSQSGTYYFPLLMGILILPLPGFYPGFFHLRSSMIFPLYRGIKVTVVSFLEEQRLDEGAKFSGLWSLNMPRQSSIVWHLWDVWAHMIAFVFLEFFM